MKLSAKMGNVSKILHESSVIAHKYNDSYILRWSVYDFTQEILNEVRGARVLEVGPRTDFDHASLPMKDIMPPFFDLGKALKELGNESLSCDFSQNIPADYHCDFIDIPGEGVFDVIIALEVLEHSPKVWEASTAFHRLLKPGGGLYVSTPFYVYHHDPYPDYWRFTEEGFEALLGKEFELDITKILWKADDGQRPVHFRVR